MGPAVIKVKLVTRAVRRGRLIIYVCMLENMVVRRRNIVNVGDKIILWNIGRRPALRISAGIGRPFIEKRKGSS